MRHFQEFIGSKKIKIIDRFSYYMNDVFRLSGIIKEISGTIYAHEFLESLSI